jgi:hypothetical protein
MPTHPDTDIITPQPKAAHTPGPWTVPDGGITPTIYADNGPIATIHDCGDTAEADATLIAAAPTMLAALRLALPELAEDLFALVDGERIGGAADWQPEEPLPADLDSDDMDLIRAKKAAYDAVLAAIKQAEGRA